MCFVLLDFWICCPHPRITKRPQKLPSAWKGRIFTRRIWKRMTRVIFSSWHSETRLHSKIGLKPGFCLKSRFSQFCPIPLTPCLPTLNYQGLILDDTNAWKSYCHLDSMSLHGAGRPECLLSHRRRRSSYERVKEKSITFQPGRWWKWRTGGQIC